MKISYQLSETAIKQQLKQGKELTAEQTVDVDFSQIDEADRDLLISYGHLYSARQEIKISTVYPDEPGLEGLIDALQAAEAEKEERARKQKLLDEVDRLIKQMNDNFPDVSGKRVYSSFSGGYNIEVTYGKDSGDYIALLDENTESADDLIEAVRVDLEGVFVEAQQKLEAIQAEKVKQEQKRLRQEQELLSWAEQHGSELLQKQIANDFDWKRRARTEYLDSIQPDGWIELSEYLRKYPVASPDQEEMEAFEQAKNLCDGDSIQDPAVWTLIYSPDHDEFADPVLPDELEWFDEDAHSINIEPDEDGDYVFSVAKITLFAPDNTTRVVMKVIKDKS